MKAFIPFLITICVLAALAFGLVVILDTDRQSDSSYEGATFVYSISQEDADYDASCV